MKFLRFLLFPFAICYDFITTLRNFFFDSGVFKETSFKLPVIVVGNLSVGGTGKTPQIEYLIRLLKDNYKTAVLSRGYKRKTKGHLYLNETHSVIDVGDEPLQYFKKFKSIDVAVNAERVEGVTKLIEEKSPEVILLDDAYQHRKIKGSYSILLTKFDNLFVDDYLLPTGNLRESRRGANRADVIVVTKCPQDLSFENQKKIKKRFERFKKEMFFTAISYQKIVHQADEMTIEDLKQYQVLLVTGIANPKSLLDFLDEKQITFQHLQYADHHNFSTSEIEFIQKKFGELTHQKKIILTTEKDYVRLESELNSIAYLKIETSFLNKDDKAFDDLIINHIEKNRCH